MSLDETPDLPRLRGRPRDPARMARVLVAAREHFSEVGFERGSMERIAAAAYVSKVTLYKYFPSKEALFNAIVTEPMRQAFDLDVAALDPADPAAALERIAETYLELITAPEILAHVRVLYASVVTAPELGKSFFETGPEALIQGLIRYLRLACLQGALAIDNAALAAEQFASMVRGNEQIRLLAGQPALRAKAARKKYCQSCVALFIKGYGP